MAKSIATIAGTALVPGVSKNGRLYTREAIGRAVARAQEQIATGKPLTVLTHHEAGDSSDRIIGRITSMAQEDDGSARFTADLADTPHARTIASLVDNTSGQPFLSGMSIRGAWVGRVRRAKGPAGEPVETADDLEFSGIDPTHKPGVEAAGIDTFAWAKDGASETDERVLITESVQEARVTAITEETVPAAEAAPEAVREALRAVFGEHVAEAATPALSKRGSGLSDDSGRAYADPGYQKDKKQRYDLTTRAKAKSAWAYVNQADNAKLYTGPQLKQVKKRIVAALKKFGVTVAAEGWTIDPALQITEALAEYAGMDPECAGSYSLSATNGPTTVTVCSYGLDPADLTVILAKACTGAGVALAALDPDMDGDIDVPGADAEDTDGDAAQGTSLPDNGDGVDSLVARMMAAIRGESAEDVDALVAEARSAAAVTETAPVSSPAPEPDAAPQGKESPVTEATTQEAVAQAPAASPAVPEELVQQYMAKLAKKEAKRRLAAGTAPAESAPAAPVTETDDERINRIVAEQVASRLAEGVQETDDQRIARLVEERLVTERQRLTEQGGGPGRKGLSPSGAVNETVGAGPAGEGLNAHGLPTDWPDKPLHQFSSDELDTYVGPAVTRHYLGDRANLLA